MAKHDESFKLEVVRRYLSESSGAQAIALRYGRDHSTVRRWVKGYLQHGVQGLRKKYGHDDAQFKLGVLRQMWAEELSCRQASAPFDVRGGHNVVLTWERQYHEGGVDALIPKPRGRPKKMTVPKPSEPTPRMKTMRARCKRCARKTNTCARRWRT